MSYLKEINKYLKQISAEKLKKNYRGCIELYNVVGSQYSEIGSYEEACHYHEQALELCKTIGDRLGTAVAFRFIGEAKAALGNFSQAIDFIKKYLDLVQKMNNKVEIQRANTTLGRVYLMQAQDLKDKNNVIDKGTKDVACEAEKRFQTALNLAESVRDQVDAKEHAQMIGGLLINLGLIKDICGQSNEAVGKFNKAIETYRAAKLKEDLYRAQIILAGIYRQRNDIKSAVKISEEALNTAKSIGKKLLICDALIERGQVRICQRDFKNAKRTFAQAYLEKTPSEEDHAKAIKLTKLAHLISENYDKICTVNTPSDHLFKTCDKLGDLFVAIGNYKLAIEFYRRAFTVAKVCAKPKSELARILYSVAETYADDGQFNHALLCYEKELSYRDGYDKEQCHSLIKIGHMHEYLEHEPEKVCEAYEKALDKAGKDPKSMHSVLRYYVPYMKSKFLSTQRCTELENVFLNLKSYPEVSEEIESEEQEESNDLEDEISNIDDILTDDEDNDEVLMIGRRKAKGLNKFKPNEVGDTPLHEAAIKGDIKRVKSLVAQGHDINPRDNAGWIPLHEACNHGHYNVAEFLIENGADVNNRGLRGMSPLHDSATNGHYEIMRLLMKNGANVIALTDTGETVLSCLRDYKSRNYSTMSNRDMSEYKQMEAELLNVMDKCGFNLMAENMKNLGSKSVRSSDSAHTTTQTQQKITATSKPHETTHTKARTDIRFASREVNPPIASTANAASVKEYRDAIVTLKRKRPLDSPEPSKRASQPATVQSSFSTSASTKQWLLDDDIIEKEEDDDEFCGNEITISNVQAKKVRERNKIICDDDDDEVMLISESNQRTPSTSAQSYQKSKLSDLNMLDSHQAHDNSSNPFSVDWNTEVSPLRNVSDQVKTSSDNPTPHFTNHIDDSQSTSPTSLNWRRPTKTNDQLDISNQPLRVTIDDRRLLVPIKDEYTTIEELKQSIVERYSILIDAKPVISLAPESDPECCFFDKDLCRDVIRENVIAKIDSWQLQSIETTYTDFCREHKLEPVDFVRIKLRDLDQTECCNLDLMHMRFPLAHIKPIIKALARRDFTSAKFQGSSCWFGRQVDVRDFMESTIFTWNRLARLNLKCCGLLKSHFEFLCNSKFKLPELQYIDVSVNSIAYKSKDEFASQAKKLYEQVSCRKLKRLDVRKNHLLFVKSFVSELTANNLSPPSTTEAATKCNGKHEIVVLDISKALELSDIEILAGDQYEYALTNTLND